MSEFMTAQIREEVGSEDDGATPTQCFHSDSISGFGSQGLSTNLVSA